VPLFSPILLSLSPDSVDGMEKELRAPFLPEEAGGAVDDHNALLSFPIWVELMRCFALALSTLHRPRI
jgi:hypothetical protein